LSITYSNTSALLNVLGLRWDDEDCMSERILVSDFIAACERFLNSKMAAYVDRGTSTFQERNWFECGLREGYFTCRITLALQMAREAQSKQASYCMFL